MLSYCSYCWVKEDLNIKELMVGFTRTKANGGKESEQQTSGQSGIIAA
jgi:hypothetical protein